MNDKGEPREPIDMLRAKAAEHVITSKLLILQSRRLSLNSMERRLKHADSVGMRARVASLRVDTAEAEHEYRTTILHWGSPENADYWLIAYSRLIQMGNALRIKLRDAAVVLPLPERYQVSADIEMLEEIVERWKASMREAMAAGVA